MNLIQINNSDLLQFLGLALFCLERKSLSLHTNKYLLSLLIWFDIMLFLLCQTAQD